MCVGYFTIVGLVRYVETRFVVASGVCDPHRPLELFVEETQLPINRNPLQLLSAGPDVCLAFTPQVF